MRALRLLAGLAVVGAAVVALREVAARGGLPRPGKGGADAALEPGGEEPVLGYDGMDRDSLIDWLSDADLDRETLLRVRAYEEANRNREPVLEAVATLLD
jgi:hypothetical protein